MITNALLAILTAASLSAETLLADWRIQHSDSVIASPEQISSRSFDDSQWIPARVPGTVLGAYVDAGLVPDPFYGDNMDSISESFFNASPFWYRTSFVRPELSEGGHLWLHFHGVNWKSEIYLNGSLLGNTAGAFRRYEYDVTSLLEDVNSLAVKVIPPEFPGYDVRPDEWRYGQKVTRKYIGCKTTNGGTIGFDSPTFMASGGWNWMPIVRGRNIGLWNKVALTVNSSLRIIDPWVSTTLNARGNRASLQFAATIANDSDRDVRGTFKIKVAGKTVRKRLAIPAGSKVQVTRRVKLLHPKLWWPNGYGEPNLETADLSFRSKTAADSRSLEFGIRDLRCSVRDSILHVAVNGQDIMLRGGNWGMAEAMLRCDSLGYDTRVKLHRDVNFNIIRNWVGQTGHDEFYRACDRYGILVFDDFWLANPNDGPEPLDKDMFYDNAIDKVRAVRNHPCVAFYCGRNEGDPPADMDARLREIVSSEDPTRYYVPNSAAGVLTGLGPYDQQEVDWYFENRGRTLHSELGIIALPEIWSFPRFMPEKNRWPINDMWAIHDYQTPRSMLVTGMIEHKFGKAQSLEDYIRKAQMLTSMLPKAMYESLRSNQGSGTLIWMSQAAWPSLICQIYDHYFEPTSAYFSIKHACEPVHILYNPVRKVVEVANNSRTAVEETEVTAEIWSLAGEKLADRTETETAVIAGETVQTFELPVPESMSGRNCLVRLYLRDAHGVISENSYWLEDAEKSCLELADMQNADLSLECSTAADGQMRAKITNTSGVPALNVRLRLVKPGAEGEESVLPVYYSDNYLILLPGESKEVIISCREAISADMSLKLYGWNIN